MDYKDAFMIQCFNTYSDDACKFDGGCGFITWKPDPSHSIDGLQMMKMYGQGLARRKEIHEQQEYEDNTSYAV